MDEQFHQGDRVRIRNTAQHGVITRVYLSVHDTYEVEIEATGRRQIMRGSELALVPEASREYGRN
jgi:hypothetical protein